MSESVGVKSVMAGLSPSIAVDGARYENSMSTSSASDREKVCQDFESFMLYSMLKYMEKTTKLSKKGYQEETYMAMVYQKVADFMAEKGIGIKEMLMKYTEKENIKVNPAIADNTGKR
jgi:Rod binding domain-containing protein